MLPDIALEALRYFDRAALERLQMYSRHLRDLVDRHARSLPLRPIDEIAATNGDVRIRRQEDYSVATQAPLEMLLNLVNNAFIYQLSLTFRRDDLRLFDYLRANASVLQCQIGSLTIESAAEGIDYALLDFLGPHLKPQIYKTSIWTRHSVEDYACLFAHNALRGTVKHLIYELYGPPAPDCIIPQLFGTDVVETCIITTRVDPRPWINKFVGKFGSAEYGTRMVRSVTLLHKRFGDTSPWRDTVGPLEQPRQIDVPTPHSAFIKEWYRNDHFHHGITAIESTVASHFVFENAKTAKKLEVFV